MKAWTTGRFWPQVNDCSKIQKHKVKHVNAVSETTWRAVYVKHLFICHCTLLLRNRLGQTGRMPDTFLLLIFISPDTGQNLAAGSRTWVWCNLTQIRILIAFDVTLAVLLIEESHLAASFGMLKMLKNGACEKAKLTFYSFFEGEISWAIKIVAYVYSFLPHHIIIIFKNLKSWLPWPYTISPAGKQHPHWIHLFSCLAILSHTVGRRSEDHLVILVTNRCALQERLNSKRRLHHS